MGSTYHVQVVAHLLGEPLAVRLRRVGRAKSLVRVHRKRGQGGVMGSEDICRNMQALVAPTLSIAT